MLQAQTRIGNQIKYDVLQAIAWSVYQAKKNLVNGKEVYKLKAGNRNINFPTQFFLGRISNNSDAVDSRKISVKGMCMIFQLMTMLLINLRYYTFTNI